MLVHFRDMGCDYAITSRWHDAGRSHEPISSLEAEWIVRSWARASEPHELARLLEPDVWDCGHVSWNRTAEQLALEALERGALRVFRAVQETIVLPPRATAVEEEPPITEPPEDVEETTHWIQLEVVDDEGAPLAGVEYELALADGSIVRGRTNAQGVAYHDGLEPGACELRLPCHDREAWSLA